MSTPSTVVPVTSASTSTSTSTYTNFVLPENTHSFTQEQKDQITQHVVGKSYNDVCNDPNLCVRASCVNGEHMCLTMDYRETRVNVHTENGVVTHVSGFN